MRRSQRLARFRLLSLPTDLLRYVGRFAASPALVVAGGRVDGLRAELDAIERERQSTTGWAPVTVAEAAARLRARGFTKYALATRESAAMSQSGPGAPGAAGGATPGSRASHVLSPMASPASFE